MRSHFNRSALVRQLAGLLPVQPDSPRQDLAERLGEWLNVRDAINLHAAHQALPQRTAPRPAGRHSVADLQAALENLRATLQQAIAAPPALPIDAQDAGFALHNQRCLDLQRRMELAIEPFRGHVRQVLASSSPPLAQLAALDATLEQWLAGREHKLLSGVPAFLKARLQSLRQTEPDTWPAPFEQELQQALRAELDLRLQPVTGLIEALAQAASAPP